jgi:hypothetical protein
VAGGAVAGGAVTGGDVAGGAVAGGAAAGGAVAGGAAAGGESASGRDLASSTSAPAGGPARSRDAVFLRVVLAGGAVLAVGLAVVLFFAGTAVGGAADARGSDSGPVGAGGSSSATAIPEPASTPTPMPPPGPAAAGAVPTGPAAPGVHDWDALAGGECLSGFTSPWTEQFTVVDCAGEHTAQLVTRGLFTDPADPASAAAPFPGEVELAGRLNLLCTAPAVLDYAAAGALPDVQWQAAYPVTEAEWAEGHRSYFCFFSRTSGEPLAASLAAPRA